MKRLVFLTTFVLLVIGTIAWLTGLESPFSRARTHSVLRYVSSGTGAPNAAANNESVKYSAPSLLLGPNVDTSRQQVSKQQVAAAAAVPSLVGIEIVPDAHWGKESPAKKLLARLRDDGVVPDEDGQGKGFFVDTNGTVLTTFSAVVGGFAWNVLTTDGGKYPAELVGVDALSDLALLRIDRQDTVPIRWSNVLPSFAEKLLMLGFDHKEGPLVMDVMVSSGMHGDMEKRDTLIWEHYLVDNDSLNKRAGWLLLNLEGGATGIVARVGKENALGLRDMAVMASPGAQAIIEALNHTPVIHRMELGIEGKELNAALAKTINSKVEHGFLVEQVAEQSPLRETGLQAGDIILSFGDTNIKNKLDIVRLAAAMVIGARVPIVVQRDNQQVTLQLVLTETKDSVEETLQQWVGVVAASQKKQAEEPERTEQRHQDKD